MNGDRNMSGRIDNEQPRISMLMAVTTQGEFGTFNELGELLKRSADVFHDDAARLRAMMFGVEDEEDQNERPDTE